ncbi:helix-turn-helix transcriptional regulator [Streptomyces sp. NPDC051639]|uniref:helix-turn-helix transcriptional regulator n=1 Tax=unclassified Streptomyces TaxID=2593676 RepID=UPI00143EE7CE|nr:helix-turn-helix transcriptional regulator [Streptomyces sp. RPA4-2]QIY64356.1 helix-turn-helix transcriptional regulator [Streptomyces sp. RPA4-2]
MSAERTAHGEHGEHAEHGEYGAHGELGAALRHWRDRTAPREAGLPTGGVRRAPGLRREELAQLAGLSVDYVTRLERGRATSPSDQVLTALSRALRLSEAEREHLFRLAGQAPPAAGHISRHVPPSVQRLLDQLRLAPLGVHDAAYDLISWNPLWAALVGDPSEWRGRERNYVWRQFAGLPTRVTHTPEQLTRLEAALVSDLRSATARYPEDGGLRSLIADLRRESDRFRTLWAAHTVGFHTADTKTVHHPGLGTIVVDCDTLTVPGADLRITVCSAAPGTEAAEQLALLAAVGPRTTAVTPG